LNKISEGEASTTNINEGDGSGLLSSIVNALKAKMNRFEQHFENFQSETNRDIDVLFHKSETNSNEQTEEIDRLRDENHQLKLAMPI
jgi:polyhydroxyalkanoate synthesis regulator phasin